MGRIVVAFRALIAALLSADMALRLKSVLDESPLSKVNGDEKRLPPGPSPPPSRPARSEAITLLATLQRESRLVDLVMQPLSGFSDDQIGAAARNVLGDCRAVIDRCFGLQPLAAGPEGSSCTVPAGYDPACFKLTGRIEGGGPFQGQIVHHGWRATITNLPAWTGSKEAALVIAPAEVEVT
jgi:hypothetical protein